MLGNFPQYYEFNPPAQLLGCIPDAFWREVVQAAPDRRVRLLDVGCNDGTLTDAFRLALLERGGATAVHAVGVDIDAGLIARGAQRFPDCTLIAEDVAAAADDGASPTLRESFDLVTCFGVTMWVHLNYGDEGLQRLLDRLAAATAADHGRLVLEPQLWKSYKNARRRLRVASAAVPASFFQPAVVGQAQLSAYMDAALRRHFAARAVLGETENWGRVVFAYSGRRSAPAPPPPSSAAAAGDDAA